MFPASNHSVTKSSQDQLLNNPRNSVSWEFCPSHDPMPELSTLFAKLSIKNQHGSTYNLPSTSSSPQYDVQHLNNSIYQSDVSIKCAKILDRSKDDYKINPTSQFEFEHVIRANCEEMGIKGTIVLDGSFHDQQLLDQPLLDQQLLDQPLLDQQLLDQQLLDQPLLDQRLIDQPLLEDTYHDLQLLEPGQYQIIRPKINGQQVDHSSLLNVRENDMDEYFDPLGYPPPKWIKNCCHNSKCLQNPSHNTCAVHCLCVLKFWHQGLTLPQIIEQYCIQQPDLNTDYYDDVVIDFYLREIRYMLDCWNRCNHGYN